MRLENKVRVVSHFCGSAAMNLAREEALFLRSVDELKIKGSFNPIIGLYSFSRPSVILGNQQPISEVDAHYCDENDIDITMRKTGGGSVFLSPEEMQYFYILPFKYSRDLLRRINIRIQAGLGDAGFSSQLRLINNHHVLRIGKDNSFVFDAQRSRIVYRGDINNPAHILLHHGTILIDDKDYGHMPHALKAPPEIAMKLQKGNLWLRNEQELKIGRLIQVLQKNLPFYAKTYRKDFSSDELELAQKLYDEFYSIRSKFSCGKKSYGICYIPGPDYDMEKYRVNEVDEIEA